MRGLKIALHLAAAAAGLISVPGGAAGQCRLCETPVVGRDVSPDQAPVALEVETSLDFDRLVVVGPGEGSASLLPDGSRTVTGVVSSISGRAMVGQVIVRGEPGRSVRIDLPRRIDLYSIGGRRILIDEITSDAGPAPRLDGGGTLSFRFGGRLHVSGDAEGEYRGDVPITVEYL